MLKQHFLILCLILTLQLLHSNNKTLISASSNWPPYVDAESETNGICLEIIREAFKTQDYTVKILIIPWSRAVNGVIEGTYDILPDVWFTKQRSENLLFSDPFLTNKIKILSRKNDQFSFVDIDSLKGKKVGYVRDFSYSQEFEDSDIFEKVATNFFIQNIYQLLSNKVDLTLEDELVAIKIIKDENPELLDKIKFSDVNFNTNNLHIACGYKNPKHKEIINSFNKGLEIIKLNGIYDQILKKYKLFK